MHDWLKRQSEIAASVVALIAVVGGLASAVGGRLPPWPTLKEFNDLKTTVNMLRVDVDAQQNTTARQQCDDWNRRLHNAEKRLSKEYDPVDDEIAGIARLQIRMIPTCMEY